MAVATRLTLAPDVAVPGPRALLQQEREAEEEKRRLAIEEEEAKKRALAEKYGVSSDEDEDDVANPLPGTANGVSKHSGNNLAALSARSGQDGFAVDVSDSDEG